MKHNISYLFLRGLSRNQFHWKDGKSYSERLGGNVHFIDPPGFGVHNSLSSPKTIAGITDFIKLEWDRITKADKSSKKVIVGLSLGGMTALDWISRYQEDWTGAVIINSSVSSLSFPWQRIRPQNLKYLPRYAACRKPRAIEEVIYDATCNSTDNKNTILDEWTGVRNTHVYNRKNVINQLLAASVFKAPAKEQIKTPCLVLTGKQDRLVCYKCSEAIAKHYGFQIEYSETSGHDMCVDQDTWMLNQIKGFAAKISES